MGRGTGSEGRPPKVPVGFEGVSRGEYDDPPGSPERALAGLLSKEKNEGKRGRIEALRDELRRTRRDYRNTPPDANLQEIIRRATDFVRKAALFLRDYGDDFYEQLGKDIPEAQAEVNHAATEHYQERERLAETFTKVLRNVILPAGDSNLVWLDDKHRVKQLESLRRKLAFVWIKGTVDTLEYPSARALVARIHDGLRYTLVIDSTIYGETVKAAVDALQAHNFLVFDWRYQWPDGPAYKGLNSGLVVCVDEDGTLVADSQGRPLTFELQFHTSETNELKGDRTHFIYEVRRSPYRETDTELRKACRDADRVWETVAQRPHVPLGILLDKVWAEDHWIRDRSELDRWLQFGEPPRRKGR